MQQEAKGCGRIYPLGHGMPIDFLSVECDQSVMAMFSLRVNIREKASAMKITNK